jgi:hypothetical protein
MEWKVSRESLITMGWLPTGQTVWLLKKALEITLKLTLTGVV